jgi:hypothetical protein
MTTKGRRRARHGLKPTMALAATGALIVAVAAACTQSVDTSIAVTCQHFVPGQGFVQFPSTVSVKASLPTEVESGGTLTVGDIELAAPDIGAPDADHPMGAVVAATDGGLRLSGSNIVTAPPLTVDVSGRVTAPAGTTLELSLVNLARSSNPVDELKTTTCTPTGDEPFATIAVVAPGD